MRIDFRQPYKSIKAFPTIELPSFSVIVGINGSGKSHFLQAIASGKLGTDVTTSGDWGSHPHPDIQLITASDIAPTGKFGVTEAKVEPQKDFRPPLFLLRSGILEQFRLELLQVCSGQQFLVNLLESPDPFYQDVKRITDRVADHSIKDQVKKIFQEAERALVKAAIEAPTGPTDKMGHLNPLPFALRAAQHFGKSILSVSQDDLVACQPQISKQFSINWNSVCTAYRGLFQRNELAKARDRRNDENSSISDIDFQHLHGPAPWLELTRSMQAFGLPYAVVEGDLFSQDSFVLALERTDTGEAVQFEDLSSGEGVILRFVLALNDRSGLSTLTVKSPKLLLLDELDAWLHPEMIQKWVSVIQTDIVHARNIICVITTHSPTTVALAPESSLFRMSGNQRSLEKCSKQSALNTLTIGVPSLSIDFSARRHIFTESQTDAILYEKILDNIKSILDLPRTLNFVSVGFSTCESAELNGGCVGVRSIVASLRNNHALGVFGIVDWDGVNQESNYVRVLQKDHYYSIENVLLDPLLICFLLIKIDFPPLSSKALPKFSELRNQPQENLQYLAQLIQDQISFPKLDQMLQVHYLNEHYIEVEKGYMFMRGHDLELLISQKFKCLSQFAGGSGSPKEGGLKRAIVRQVLAELPEFTPNIMAETFRSLACVDEY